MLAMKAYRAVELWLHPFLTLALDSDEYGQFHNSAALLPDKESPVSIE
jgi:hypothetical protein